MIFRIFKKYWPLIAITTVIFTFLSQLFFPKQSLFVIPDYGRSDSWSLSIADSFYYAQELKHNNFPIWNPHISSGFPVFAEGQTGELYPLNLVLFKILPFGLAYNLTITLTLIIAAAGTYLFCRSLNLSKIASLSAGIVFSLGGFFIFHLQHHALIESASLLPWTYWATNEFIKRKRVAFLLLLSTVAALQLLTGFPQLAFYTQVSIFGYLLISVFSEKKLKLKVIFYLSAAFALGYLLAAAQLVPTYEFLQLSTRTVNPSEILTQFPYTFKNLLQFLNPYILGSPKYGSYPLWQPGKWGIFWESSAYVGIVPLALALAVVIGNFTKRKAPITVSFSILLVIALLLSLGQNSPLYVIFTIPPFSLFRVPSRFLLTAEFSLAILMAIYINRIKSSPLASAIVLVSIINLFLVLKNYNPTLPANKLFRDPPSVQYLKKNSAGNIYSVGVVNKWNQNFVANGWGNMNKFFFFENYLDQNSNLIFDINQFSAYESLQTRRQAFLKSQLASNIKFANGKYYFSDKAIKLLAASNTTHIISPFAIESSLIDKAFQASGDGSDINIYKIKNPPGALFLSGNFSNVQTIPDITKTIAGDNFNPLDSPMIEGQTEEKPIESQNSKIQVISRSDTSLVTKILVDHPQILTFNQSLYPGWEAYIDNQKVPIIPSNINSMAIKVPEGEHKIIFKYYPRSLIIGSLISVISMIIFFLIFKFKSKARLQ